MWVFFFNLFILAMTPSQIQGFDFVSAARLAAHEERFDDIVRFWFAMRQQTQTPQTFKKMQSITWFAADALSTCPHGIGSEDMDGLAPLVAYNQTYLSSTRHSKSHLFLASTPTKALKIPTQWQDFITHDALSNLKIKRQPCPYFQMKSRDYPSKESYRLSMLEDSLKHHMNSSSLEDTQRIEVERIHLLLNQNNAENPTVLLQEMLGWTLQKWLHLPFETLLAGLDHLRLSPSFQEIYNQIWKNLLKQQKYNQASQLLEILDQNQDGKIIQNLLSLESSEHTLKKVDSTFQYRSLFSLFAGIHRAHINDDRQALRWLSHSLVWSQAEGLSTDLKEIAYQWILPLLQKKKADKAFIAFTKDILPHSIWKKLHIDLLWTAALHHDQQSYENLLKHKPRRFHLGQDTTIFLKHLSRGQISNTLIYLKNMLKDETRQFRAHRLLSFFRENFLQSPLSLRSHYIDFFKELKTLMKPLAHKSYAKEHNEFLETQLQLLASSDRHSKGFTELSYQDRSIRTLGIISLKPQLPEVWPISKREVSRPRPQPLIIKPHSWSRNGKDFYGWKLL